MDRYRQDTLKVLNLLKQPDSIGKGELNLRRSEILLRPIQQRDNDAIQTVTEVKTEIPKVPTRTQLRYRWWQQEQKLVVGDSRYINPSGDVRITSTEKIENGLVLPNHNIEAKNTDWLTFLLIAILVLFATVRTNYSKYMSQLLQSVINYSSSTRMFQEKNYAVEQGALRLEIFFYMTFSVFIFQVFKYFNVSLPYRNIWLFLFSFGLVAVYFIGKKLIYRFSGIVTEHVDETSEFVFNMDNLNRVMGLVLFPVVLLIAFYPGEDPAIAVLTGIIIAVILYLMLLYRGTIILLKKQFSIFYLFLYFCTLEFLPLVLLYKIVVL